MNDKKVETIVSRSPMGEHQFTEGKLVITMKMSDEVPSGENYTEALKACPEHEGAGFMTIDAEIIVGDLTQEQLEAHDPQQYMDNGVIAGILDAVRNGLASERGINFRYAVQDAKEKAENAVACINAHELGEKLQETLLAVSDVQGEA